MSQQKKNGRRKALAVGLAVLGVAGLSLASAAQLQLNGRTNVPLVQAGVSDLSASLCQTSQIDVTFTLDGATAGELSTGGTFGYPAGADAISLTGISEACEGKNLKVALGATGGTLVGAEYAGEVPADGNLVLALNGNTPAFGDEFTNAQIDSIAQISVTIFD